MLCYSDNRYSDKMFLKNAQLYETVRSGLNVELLRSGSALVVELQPVKRVEKVPRPRRCYGPE